MDKKISLSGFSLAFLSIIFLGAIMCVGYIPSQQDFTWIIGPYAIAFIIYLFVVFYIDANEYFAPLLALAILVRCGLVFSFPNLSDDIYRFLWDANLVLEGKNPYMYLPADIVNSENKALFEKLNSPEYYSPYPPVSQLIYTTSAAISAGQIHLFAIIIKAFTLLAEIGSIYFIIKILGKLKLSRDRVFIYALNPLILIELIGNLHFESFMVLFMLMAVYYLMKDQLVRSSLTFVLAIISKLLPLMFTPFLLAYLGMRKAVKFSIITGLALLIVLIPVFVSMFSGSFFSSVGLYFQKFEFNASLYYLLRALGFIITGYNQIGIIGPTLALTTLATILWIWFKYKTEINQHNVFLFLLFAISMYLFCATTIHPWYIALPLVFCLFTDFRYPVIWSGLVMLTYINYSFTEYHEVMLAVILEYSIVFGFLIYEFKKVGIKKAFLS